MIRRLAGIAPLDPLTHMLTGACLGRAGLNRRSALATATLVVAAEISDVDVLWEFDGRVAALQHHRGWTHSFVGIPAMAALALLLVWGWKRIRRRPATVSLGRPRPPARLRLLFALACLGAASHILLDYTTAYGVRLLEPFSYRWYSWDIVSIIDPWILAALLAGLIVPSLFALINEEIGAGGKGFRGRGGAIFALVALAAIWGVRDYQHRRAVAELNARTYRGQDPLRVAAYPYPWNPLRWHGVIETPDFFATMDVESAAAEVDPRDRARLYYKPPETAVTLAAKQSRLGRVYLDWAAYPYVEEERLEPAGDYLVRFYDLRYRYPDTRRTPLAAAVELNSKLEVTAIDFGIRGRKQR